MKRNPLVVCLTNTVAANFTANGLLALGAKPAMVEEASEAAELTAHADALLVNLGTVTVAQAEAMRAAVKVATEKDVPWVLDPVGIQLLTFRRTLALELIKFNPTLIRGNHSEIDVLLGTVPTLTGTVPILSTGETDRIITASGTQEVPGGVPLLQAVTATGCLQGALCAALLGRGQTPGEACLSVSRLMKRAGERAFERAQTPGSFQIALLDALWELNHD